MKIRISIIPKTFHTAFIARTSRGSITQKRSWFVILEAQGGIGIGEGAPLPGLSLDGEKEWERLAAWLEAHAEEVETPVEAYTWAASLADRAGVGRASSVLYALESAALSLLSGKSEVYYPGAFAEGDSSVPINGLVWMDTLPTMRAQAEEKVRAGFATIKFKIGSFDWVQERALLEDFRKTHSADEITVRVDANGAYTVEQALRVLDDLARLGVHSIEQPIRAGQYNAMKRLIAEGAVPVALDEELISPMPEDEMADMLRYVNAPLWVLKPTLIGGLARTEARIRQAEEEKRGWWLTSSLETPVGLTVLAQFVARYANTLPHGLSTGKIYAEPIAHPNMLEGDRLRFNLDTRFDLAEIRRADPPEED